MRINAKHLNATFGSIYLLVLAWSAGYGIAHSLDWPVYADGGILRYLAWRMEHGAVPYRDVDDFNLPGTFLMNWLLIPRFAPGDFGFRCYDLLLTAAGGLGVAALAWRGSRLYAAAGALLYVDYHIAWGAQNMGERELMMLPFILGAVYCLRRWLENPASPRIMFVFGAAIGYAAWIKPIIVLLAVFYGVYALKCVGWRLAMKGGVYALAGMLLPTAGLLGWLYHMQALPAFTDEVLYFIPAYSGYFLIGQNITPRFCMILVYAVALLLFLLATRLKDAASDRAIIAIGLVYGLLHFFGQGKGAWYHLYPLAAFMIVFFSVALPRLHLRVAERVILSAIMLLLCIHFSPVQSMGKENLSSWRKVYPPSASETLAAEVAGALAQVPPSIREPYLQARPDAAIQWFGQVHGELWAIAYRQGWVAPLRQIYSFGFYAEAFHSPYFLRLRDELYTELANILPLVLIVSPESYPFQQNLVYPALDEEPWRSCLAEHYQLILDNPSYRIYARSR